MTISFSNLSPEQKINVGEVLRAASKQKVENVSVLTGLTGHATFKVTIPEGRVKLTEEQALDCLSTKKLTHFDASGRKSQSPKDILTHVKKGQNAENIINKKIKGAFSTTKQFSKKTLTPEKVKEELRQEMEKVKQEIKQEVKQEVITNRIKTLNDSLNLEEFRKRIVTGQKRLLDKLDPMIKGDVGDSRGAEEAEKAFDKALTASVMFPNIPLEDLIESITHPDFPLSGLAVPKQQRQELLDIQVLRKELALAKKQL